MSHSFLLATFGLGVTIGSFLNVCIYRLPLRQSVVWPASHCPTCQHPITWYDNIPLLSFLWLTGRCRQCRGPIAWRYPLIEGVNGLGYVALAWHFGLEWSTLVYGVFFSAMVVVTMIDWDYFIIPDVITLPGIVLGLVCSWAILPLEVADAVLGVLAGGSILWFMAWISPFLFGKEGMGGGDIKLLAMIGAFLGWKSTLLTLLLGALIGSVVGLSLMGLNRLKRGQYIPFGPYLAVGAILALFFHQDLFEWYIDLFIEMSS